MVRPLALPNFVALRQKSVPAKSKPQVFSYHETTRNVKNDFTSPTGALEKYCDDLCMSVRQHISGTTRAIFTSFSVHVAYMAVALYSSSTVTKSQGEEAILGFPPHCQCIVSRLLQTGSFNRQ